MGKLGWTEYEYYTSSPYMFFAACEGYFDKENEHSSLIRKQTLFIVQASGAKLKGGGDIKLTDLWLLKGEDSSHVKKVWGITKEDAETTRQEIMKAHNKVLK